MTDYYTENMAEFGMREIRELKDILTAWVDHGLPENFDNCNVRAAMNKHSGYVFLVNDDYMNAMLNDGKLEVFHYLDDERIEDFLSNIIAHYSPAELSSGDVEYVLANAKMEGIELKSPWLEIDQLQSDIE